MPASHCSSCKMDSRWPAAQRAFCIGHNRNYKGKQKKKAINLKLLLQKAIPDILLSLKVIWYMPFC